MEKKVGFIGGGVMGRAIIKGLTESKKVEARNIMVSDPSEVSRKALEALGISAINDNEELAKNSDVIFIAVKPQYLKSAVDTFKHTVNTGHIVVSIAAGVTIEMLENMLGANKKIVRVMPNTPAQVGCGMSAMAVNEKVSPEEADYVLGLLSSFGKAEMIPENLINAVIGVSGSSPAYVYMFIEALADGAVAQGLPRDKAYTFAAQAVLGSAKMVLESGQHPGALKDAVCSPGGTTIAAVEALEESGFRYSVMSAVKSACEKSKELEK